MLKHTMIILLSQLKRINKEFLLWIVEKLIVTCSFWAERNKVAQIKKGQVIIPKIGKDTDNFAVILRDLMRVFEIVRMVMHRGKATFSS